MFELRAENLQPNIISIDSLISSFESGDTTRFTQTLAVLKKELTQNGYENAPAFSYALLSSVAQKNLREDQRLLLLAAAETLSPTHPEILFSLSTYYLDLGTKKCFSLISSGLANLTDYPFLLIGITVKFLLVLGYSLFLALLLTLFGCFVFSPSEVLSFLSGYFRKEKRLTCSSLLFILIILLPIFVPLVYVAMLWALVCAYSARRLRFYPLLTALVVLSLNALLPFSENVLSVSSSKLGRALENSRVGNFVSNIEDILEKAKSSDNGALYKVLSGQLAHLKKEDQRAQSYYKEALATVGTNHGLSYVLESNLAQLDFINGKQELAYDRWRTLYDLGWREYELLYNLAIASVALYRQSDFNLYFSELKKNYKTLPLNNLEQGEPLIASIPPSTLLGLVWSEISGVNAGKLPYLSLSEKSLKIFDEASSYRLITFTLIVLIWGLFMLQSEERTYRFRASLSVDRRTLKTWRIDALGKLPILNFLFVKQELSFFLVVALLIVPLGLSLSLGYFFKFASSASFYVVLVYMVLIIALVRVLPRRLKGM